MTSAQQLTRQVNILCVWPLNEQQLNRIRAVSPAVHLEKQVYDASTLAGYLKDVEVLCTIHFPLDPVDFPRLRWIQNYGAGTEHLFGKPVMRSSVTITSAHGFHGPPMAEYVMTALLAWTRKFPQMAEYQKRHDWPANARQLFSSDGVRGKIMGILGFGHVGRAVAHMARTLGMRVLAMDEAAPAESADSPAERFFRPAELSQMLPLCDYIVVCLPLTPATTGFVGEAAFRFMQPHAYLINIARGKVVNQDALIHALRDRTIAGATVDVVDPEPLPPSSDLWDCPNLTITPHVSTLTYHYDDDLVDYFCENLRRYLAGQPLMNVIDHERGYVVR
jgi:phosphoglycerate dehydrogenase-like enzyme